MRPSSSICSLPSIWSNGRRIRSGRAAAEDTDDPVGVVPQRGEVVHGHEVGEDPLGLDGHLDLAVRALDEAGARP
jgi:hypothetical protein